MASYTLEYAICFDLEGLLGPFHLGSDQVQTDSPPNENVKPNEAFSLKSLVAD